MVWFSGLRRHQNSLVKERVFKNLLQVLPRQRASLERQERVLLQILFNFADRQVWDAHVFKQKLFEMVLAQIPRVRLVLHKHHVQQHVQI